MLVISASCDAISMLLEQYAKQLTVELHTLGMHSPDSDPVSVLAELQQSAHSPLFLFGHGDPSGGFIAYGGNTLFDEPSIYILGQRVVAAICCHGERIGAHAQTAGFSMMGYRGRLAVITRAQHLDKQRDALLAGARTIAQGEAPIAAAIAANRAMADFADTLSRSSDTLDVIHSHFIALNHADCWSP